MCCTVRGQNWLLYFRLCKELSKLIILVGTNIIFLAMSVKSQSYPLYVGNIMYCVISLIYLFRGLFPSFTCF